jgi:transcription antitermination factor NusA-like protein
MNGLLLPAYVENISTRKDKSVKIVLSTQELSPGQAGEIFNLMNHLVVAYLSVKDISDTEASKVDKIDAELGGKTQGQRIRNTLYILYSQNNEGHKDFDSYYHDKTERYIEHLKAKIL